MIVLLSFLFILLNIPQAKAIDEFTTNQSINYQFNEQGITQVEHKISIVNNFSQFYPKEYNFTLSGSNITNIQAYDDKGTIPTVITPGDDTVKLSAILTNSKVGKDQATLINIRYQSNNLALKKGKTWEVNLPQFEDNLSNNINLTLKVPISYGKLSSSPTRATISFDSQDTIINFAKYSPKNKVVLTFGEYQLFDLDLKYQIQNTTNQESIFTIPIPPDTSNQKVIYSKIDPLPQKIETDPDGNWLAFYLLKPQTKIDINATGQAKIGQNPNYRFDPKPNFSSQLFWPIDNPQIINLANTYKTPRQIYDYVVSVLDYDFNRVNNAARRGALETLKSTNTSLCTDFTDLFITIARAGNIGAREIEGFAYSNNTNIKPLSQGTDILHAWPEYYNSQSQKWIAIDPTWAKTTGGINYFDDLDLNHFAFVIHNQKSDSPSPPGSYKSDPNQKSVNITFADIENIKEPQKPVVSTEFHIFSQSYITITNPNLFTLENFAINNNPPQNILPLSQIKIDFPKMSFLSSLLPTNQNIKISESIFIQNPYHFFNMFVVIVSSLIFLSLGAIILIRHH